MRELALEKTRLDGRYEILRLLGRGSYAEIFVARDSQAAPDSPHQLVVIKALNVFLQEEPDVELERTLVENFQNEAVALDRVRHPQIISRLGHGTAKDLRGVIFHYIVLEYLPGGDLMQMCKREPLTLEKTLFYLEQVCAGLSHAHSQGVIHRDIKPQNLLLTEDKQIVMIADFGVARFTNHDAPITRVGTNIYAAPEHSPLNVVAEIASGKDVRLTPAADVYSLAKTVYALLTGESPRKFANAPLTSFPPNLAAQSWASSVLRVLERATQHDIDKRIQTVNDFWREIYLASKQTEEAATSILPRNPTEIWAASVAGFTSEPAPARPSFSSMPNVQVAPQNNLPLPQRPRVVVDVAERKPLPRVMTPPIEPVFKGVVTPQTNGNGHAAPQTKKETNVEQQHQRFEKPARPSWFVAFLKRLATRFAVILLIVGIFVGVLGGTYNFLQTRGYIPLSFPVLFAKTGVANKTAWLRSSPEIRDDNRINLVTRDSQVRVLGEEGNWYRVEIVRQGQPDNNSVTDKTGGYVGKSIIDLPQ
jgi:serine/threonine protein kinase